MHLTETDVAVQNFFRQLPYARERVLFLDYDGTLAPFHRDPDRAVPYPGVSALLERVARHCATRVIVVSGRRLADLRMPLNRIRHHEAWGAHGWERLTAEGERSGYQPSGSARRGLQLAEASARELSARGVRVERKVGSVAVHWRGLRDDSAQAVQARLARAWQGAICEDLELLDFDCGLELRARGRNKGDAVREALERCRPGAACAYLGDDTTDEDAFAALDGRGLAVLVRPEPRPTRAHAWIAPPEGLIAFLERWCECGEKAA